ncbi:MAG TPA: LytTR family DNA-binding domain-containing protein, partial [Flavisolibacter sp.]|nr:LytTR family DNA-binding domain-containing protein [Flavisolibacter sp.]
PTHLLKPMPNTAPIRCLVVDDEPLARDVLRRYLALLPSLELCGECSNAIEALSFLQQQPVDLLFLDIHMPQLKGIDLLKILTNPPKVILTTAHAEYALEGYDLDIVDYLLKPIQFERFLKAVTKAFQVTKPLGPAVPATASEEKKEAYIYLRADRKMVKVLLDDILYLESMKDYVKVFTTKGLIITKQSITAMEAMLPEQTFVRTHRSFIASITKIKSFTNELLEIEKAEIPIGKLYRNNVMKVLG